MTSQTHINKQLRNRNIKFRFIVDSTEKNLQRDLDDSEKSHEDVTQVFFIQFDSMMKL